MVTVEWVNSLGKWQGKQLYTVVIKLWHDDANNNDDCAGSEWDNGEKCEHIFFRKEIDGGINWKLHHDSILMMQCDHLIFAS